MIVNTLFHHDGKYHPGQVEVKLLPGIPYLHIVGLPDASIKECGIKLKSALKSLGLEWPAGRQIIVSLKPTDARKGGSGVELAIAMAYLAVTKQLSPTIRDALPDLIVYGELALNGQVFAPPDFEMAMSAARPKLILTGQAAEAIRNGEWLEIENLRDRSPNPKKALYDWSQHWRRPEVFVQRLPAKAANALELCVHMKLGALVVGPQGSGKTTWAKLVHSLSSEPELAELETNAQMFGENIPAWRPLEQPHHSISPQAMIGGGSPIKPGIISRAHGGVLVMDEFLEFNAQVLESLREPIEGGVIHLARRGQRETLPARFQLIGTTNLCPCGKLNPEKGRSCKWNLAKCGSTLARMSGPLLDRFDVVLMTHEWIKPGSTVEIAEVHRRIQDLEAFRVARAGREEDPLPQWIRDMPLGHRRWRSLLRVARGLADMDRAEEIDGVHFSGAFEMVVTPMHRLREIFG